MSVAGRRFHWKSRGGLADKNTRSSKAQNISYPFPASNKATAHIIPIVRLDLSNENVQPTKILDGGKK
jgi:hypothetical protein